MTKIEGSHPVSPVKPRENDFPEENPPKKHGWSSRSTVHSAGSDPYDLNVLVKESGKGRPWGHSVAGCSETCNSTCSGCKGTDSGCYSTQDCSTQRLCGHTDSC